MENITDPATPLSALALYESAIAAASAGVYVAWQDIADRLRTEAAALVGAERPMASQRAKRIARALDCESRALAQRTAAAFRAEMAARPDFVPAVAS